MKLLDTFTTETGDLIEISYLSSFSHVPNIYDWFLGNCQNLVRLGKASAGWNFEDIDFQGVVAKHGEKLVGHYAVRSDDEMKVLTDGFMFVESDYRRHRLAENLLKNLSNWGKDNGYRAVLGEVHYNNQDALAHALATGHRIMPFYMIAYSFERK